MEEIIKTFQGMESLQQAFWICALVASAIFVIQFILTIIGMDHSDMDVDFDGHDTMDLGDGLNLFTVKNFIGLLLGFGWGGVCLYDTITSPTLLILVSILIGLIFVFLFVLIYKQTRKLEADGTFNINDCLGKSASVYLRVPAGGIGKGKIQISINGSVHEILAITDEDEIPSGQMVAITEVLDSETVKVINKQYNLVI